MALQAPSRRVVLGPNRVPPTGPPGLETSSLGRWGGAALSGRLSQCAPVLWSPSCWSSLYKACPRVCQGNCLPGTGEGQGPKDGDGETGRGNASWTAELTLHSGAGRGLGKGQVTELLGASLSGSGFALTFTGARNMRGERDVSQATVNKQLQGGNGRGKIRRDPAQVFTLIAVHTTARSHRCACLRSQLCTITYLHCNHSHPLTL